MPKRLLAMIAVGHVPRRSVEVIGPFMDGGVYSVFGRRIHEASEAQGALNVSVLSGRVR